VSGCGANLHQKRLRGWRVGGFWVKKVAWWGGFSNFLRYLEHVGDFPAGPKTGLFRLLTPFFGYIVTAMPPQNQSKNSLFLASAENPQHAPGLIIRFFPATAETRITFEALSGANIEVWLLDIAGRHRAKASAHVYPAFIFLIITRSYT